MTRRRDELAKRRAQAGYSQESLAERLGVARATVARWEQGEGGLPYPRHRPKLAAALSLSADELEQLFLDPKPGEARQSSHANGRGLLAEGVVGGHDLSAATSIADLIAHLSGPPADDQAANAAAPPRGSHLADLTEMLATAKHAYQACDYKVIGRALPALLHRLDEVDDSDGRSLDRLRAHSYHLAAGVLFKLGNDEAGSAAAEASMMAAERTQDPVALCSSGRIIVQSLYTSGHQPQGVDAAVRLATESEAAVEVVDRDNPNWLSAYGSLLLRGAMSAAAADQPDMAAQLLDEAQATARRLGSDGNYQWTAFGPTNVEAHRIAAEYTLGNAGRAVQHYRQLDLTRLGTAERKTTVLLDAGRAYLAWAKFDDAMACLAQAEHAGPAEFRQRPGARQAVWTLLHLAPPSLKRSAQDMAHRVGLAKVA